MRRGLIVFAKNPEKGKVKTRLAKDIGAYQALSWYIRLLKKTEAEVQGLACVKTVFWAQDVPMHPPVFSNEEFNHKVQSNGDLGDRMQKAFQAYFDQAYDAVVIVGTDCWDLKTKHVEKAFRALQNHDVVMGPAKDGGYYLIGMKEMHKDLFKDIPWSTETVAAKTLEKINELGLSMIQLETLSDVDRAIDLPME